MIIPIETPYRTMTRAPLKAVLEIEMEPNRSPSLQNMLVFATDPDNRCNLGSFESFYAGLYRPSYDECEGDIPDREGIVAELSVDAYQLMQDMVAHF